MENQEPREVKMLVDEPEKPHTSSEVKDIINLQRIHELIKFLFQTQEVNKKPAVPVVQRTNALSLIAQYSGSESDDEDDEVDNTVYRKPVRESSSSSSSSSDEELDIKVIEKKIREPIESDGDSENENSNKKKRREPLKVKGEMSIDELPPIDDLQITVDERECTEIGVITTIVDQLGKLQVISFLKLTLSSAVSSSS